MKVRLAMIVVYLSLTLTPATAAVWQETQQGDLIPGVGSSVAQSCLPSADASYSDRKVPGDRQFSHLRYTNNRFTFIGSAAPSLQIEPTSDTEAGSVSAAFWSITAGPQQAAHSGYFLTWHDPAQGLIRQVRLNVSPLQWQPVWSEDYQPEANTWLPAELLPQRLAAQPAVELLLLPGQAQAPILGLNWQQGTAADLALPATSGTFAIAPVAVDINQDQLTDRLYLLSQQGVLWQFDWQAEQGWQASRVADLQSTGWQFNGSLQRFNARWPAGAGWLQGEVFVIQASTATDYRLIVLRRETTRSAIITAAELNPAPSLSGAGWQQTLPAAAVSQAKIVGGILYVPLKAADGCDETVTFDRLLAVQLYSGAPAYSSALLSFGQPYQAPLRLVSASGLFRMMSGPDVLIPAVVTLNPACLMCTEVLRDQHLQGQQPAAIFHAEQVY